MVSGKLLLTDSTHILANAAKEKREIIEVPDTPSEYVKKLDREALEAGLLDEPVTYPEKTKTVPLVCLRYEPDTTGKGRKCGLFSLFGCDFSRVIPLGGICQQHRNTTAFGKKYFKRMFFLSILLYHSFAIIRPPHGNRGGLTYGS